MAIKRIEHDGYGQLELNNVAFRRDGRIEAQCAFEKDAENGMVVVVDKANKLLKTPSGNNDDFLVALNYTSEHMYDDRANGLKDFHSKAGDYGRVGYLAPGDLFTTNTVSYDDADFADDKALFDAVKDGLHATPAEDGSWKITKTEAEGSIIAKVVKKTTMPDGQPAVQLQITAAI